MYYLGTWTVSVMLQIAAWKWSLEFGALVGSQSGSDLIQPFALRVHVPKKVYTLVLKYSLYRYIGPKVYTILVHGPLGLVDLGRTLNLGPELVEQIYGTLKSI